MTKTKQTDFNLNHTDLLPLPSDEELERMVLGILIDLPQFIEQIYKHLNIKGIFYNEINAKIWKGMMELNSLKMAPNSKNIEGYFKRLGDTETAIAAASMPIYAGELTMLKQYCLRLFETAVQRNIIRLGHYLNTKGYERFDALDLLAVASNAIGGLYESIAGMKTKSLSEGANELTLELAAIASSKDGMLGIKGSIPSLNNIFKGYRKGNMIVIGASSGEGKSTFMLQEVSSIVFSGKPVGVVSLEMTQSELLLKIACEKLNIEVDRALGGQLSNKEMKDIETLLAQISKEALYISETPAMKIGEIKATSRMWCNRNKIEILFIDHMHLINSDFQHTTPEQKFTDIANQIKELAKELDIPVVALAQLARKDNMTEKRMHVMTDLKYAGGIEQAADVIMMIFRPEVHNIEKTSDGQSTKGKAIIKFEKLRLLPKGSVKCEFDGLRFSETQSYQRLPNLEPVNEDYNF